MRSKLAVGLFLLCAGTAWAQQASSAQNSKTGAAADATANAATAAAPADPMRADVKKLLAVSGAEAQMRAVVGQLFASQIAGMRRLRPDIPGQFWDEFQMSFNQQFNPDELIDLIIPIYEKHFTGDEIKQLTAFYDSPIGRKYVTESAAMQAESMAAGREWGRNLGEKIAVKVAEEMRARGISPGTPPKPPIPDSLK
ncbi:MAG TPA: DUF2059 domain-containing protein [Terriglobales bacterium]|nr:DUF2059 domain-containing protein [Terriglobales bacterium]